MNPRTQKSTTKSLIKG